MTDVKLPIDARGGNAFYASGLLRPGEHAGVSQTGAPSAPT